MFIVLVCHGNDEKPGLPTKSIAFSTFRARRFSWVQVLWLRPGFGCIPADRQPGFCKEQWQKKISKKHQKLELYILYDPNFHLYCTLYLFQKRSCYSSDGFCGLCHKAYFATRVSGLKGRQYGSQRYEAGACRIDFQQYIQSNILNLPTSKIFFFWSFLFEWLISSRTCWSCEANTHAFVSESLCCFRVAKHWWFSGNPGCSYGVRILSSRDTGDCQFGTAKIGIIVQWSILEDKKNGIIGVANDTWLDSLSIIFDPEDERDTAI